MEKLSSAFTTFARHTACITGNALSFCVAALIIVVWAVAGPMFHYSDTWQLVINTGTTIVTFLMVFLIQNTQNRDTQAMQSKLDELIRAIKGADNAMLDLEEMDDKELQRIHKHYATLAKAARAKLDHKRDEEEEEKYPD